MPGGGGSTSGLLEVDRDRVHAVAESARCLRSVRENVTEVGVAARAANLGADHAVRAVGDLLNGAGNGLAEAGPAAAVIELGCALEQGIAAGRAAVQPI